MVYLTRNPTWLRRVREEVETVAARHCSDASLPLADKLTHVPLEAWESEFQAIDICLRECIRLQLLGAAIRRNVSGKDVKVGNEIIPNGAFAVSHISQPTPIPHCLRRCINHLILLVDTDLPCRRYTSRSIRLQQSKRMGPFTLPSRSC